MNDPNIKEPTLEEVNESLRRTQQDHERLERIIENFSLFIYDTDQDRSDMVGTLQQLRGLLHFCSELRTKIRVVKNQMEQGEN